MFWQEFYQVRQSVRSSLWVVPIIAIPFAMFATRLAHWLDLRLQWTLLGFGVKGAEALLQATVTAALSFLVFTFGSLLVALQVASGQMTLLKGGEEIVPGISVKIFPGHTAHMMGVIVQSGGKTAGYISDLIPTTAHIDITWGMGFDLYPLETIESKKLYYAQAIPEKWLTVFTHDPKVPWAYLERNESGKMVAKGA